MAEVQQLERLQGALGQFPAYPAIPEAINDRDPEFIELGEYIIRLSKRWLADVKDSVRRTRRHPDHTRRAMEVWPSIEPNLTKVIRQREAFIKTLVGLLERDGWEDRDWDLIDRVRKAVIAEHKGLVDIYYQLKADADALADDTRPSGKVIETPEQLASFFAGVRKD